MQTRATLSTSLIFTGAAVLIPILLASLLLCIKRRSPTVARLSHSAKPPAAYIIQNHISHARLLPKEASHGFTYPALFFMVSLNALESHSLDCGAGWLFGYQGVSFRITGMRSSAYLHADGCSALSIKEKLRRLLKERGYEHEGDALEDAWMLTMPSYLGYEGINPLTVYFCYRKDAQLPWAVVLEVHNTFGERHAYILRIGVLEDDEPAKGYRHQWTFSREFHVSPFNDRAGSYVVSVTVPPCSPSRMSNAVVIGNSADLFHPRIRIHLFTSTDVLSEYSGQLKLTATMWPTNITPWTSANLATILLRHPLVLFLSLPRILFHAWKLHYNKRLPVYPRPEPHPDIRTDDVEGCQVTSCGGIGWQPETWLQQLARARLQRFLKERVRKVRISVTLISGNALVPPIYYAYADSQLEESKQTLTISYLSPAFFSLMVEAPSARHALLFGKTSKLFSPSSEELFLRVFSHSAPPTGDMMRSHVTIAQSCRLLLLPSQLRSHPDLYVPHQHIVDPTAVSLDYLGLLACLLLSLSSSVIEEISYRIFQVRFVAGQEPWRHWIDVGVHLRIFSSQ